MFIKKVTINGFMSFKDAVIEDLSPNLNCVVGAKGSGKSNFIHAICFVLGELFRNPSDTTNSPILHGEGETEEENKVLTAFVEILFSNVPGEKPDLCLRRSITSEKDEYSLDGKPTTKNFVLELLINAGFSYTKPFYVVHRGKITSLTLMEDSGRLDLLKEISVIGIYEEECRKKLQSLEDTGTQRNQINKVVIRLDETFKELDEQRAELNNYQQQMILLDYFIRIKDIERENENLLLLKQSKQVEYTERKTLQLNHLYTMKDDVNKELKVLRDKSKSVNRQLKKQAEVKYQLKVAMERKNGDQHVYTSLEEQINKTTTSEDVAENQQYSEGSMGRDDTNRIMSLERELTLLLQKQHLAQVASKGDDELTKEFNKVLHSYKEQERMLVEHIRNLESDLQAQNNHVVANIKSISEIATKLSNLYKGDFQKDFGSFVHQQKCLLDDNDKLTKRFKIWMKAKESLNRATPEVIRIGIHRVKELCLEHNIVGVYGSVLELIKCEEKFFDAVEAIAGDSLFHLVVNSVETSNQVNQLLKANEGAGVTYIYLDWDPVNVSYPICSGAVPLIHNLYIDEKIDIASRKPILNAIHKAFGRVMVCDTWDIATHVSSFDGIEGITYKGIKSSENEETVEEVYNKGCSKLKLMHTIRDSICDQQYKTELENINQKVKVAANYRKKTFDVALLISKLEDCNQDVANAEEFIQDLNNALLKKGNLLGYVKWIKDQIEKATPVLLADGGRDSKSRILEIKRELGNLRKNGNKIETNKAQLDCQKVKKMMRSKEEIASFKHIMSLVKRDMDAAEERVKELKISYNDVSKDVSESSITHAEDLINIYKKKLERKGLLRKLDKILQEKHEREGKIVDLNERIKSMHKYQEEAQKYEVIASLLADPSQMNLYAEKTEQFLRFERGIYMKKFEMLSNVNKKALDGYERYKGEHERLKEMQTHYNDAYEGIKDGILALQSRKDKNIESIFKSVCKNFEDVFSKLVIGGRGSLKMLEKKKKVGAPVDEEWLVEKYTGVEVKVSFEPSIELTMRQLTQNQKSVVALALIFAIQELVDFPFYLFDEIDLTGESQYRYAVSNVVSSFATERSSQMIITTSSPQLIKAAGKIYGVKRDLSSHVDTLDLKQALDIISLESPDD